MQSGIRIKNMAYLLDLQCTKISTLSYYILMNLEYEAHNGLFTGNVFSANIRVRNLSFDTKVMATNNKISVQR